jgi:hypothetical protein
MINDYANKAKVSSDNSLRDHQSKIWEFIFAVEKASNYTATELGAVLGIKEIVKMDDDSELYMPMVHSTHLQSCPSCACEKSKETTQGLLSLEGNGENKDFAESKDCLRKKEIANILSEDLYQRDGMKNFLQKGSQLLGKEYSLHTFIAAPLYPMDFFLGKVNTMLRTSLRILLRSYIKNPYFQHFFTFVINMQAKPYCITWRSSILEVAYSLL